MISSTRPLTSVSSQPVKRATWLYLILLIFEGALRKWGVPALASPLLLVRDPVAAFILIQGLRQRRLPQSPIFYLSLALGAVAILLAMLLGHGDAFVAVYGARSLLLHFPAMFVMARALDRRDILQMGRFVMILSLGMSVLIVLQFYSPQSAFVNRGVAGEGSSAGFSGALGYFRPPGTFSFTNGVTLFYALLAPFVLYFWLNPGLIKRRLLLAATFSLIVALPFSVSRSLLFQTAIAVAFAAIAASTRPRMLQRGVIVALIAVLALMIVGSFGFFQTAVEVMQARFTSANEAEGGLNGVLGDRYVGGLLAAFTQLDKWPVFGMGIGMGTNAGAVLLSGQATFLIAEGEWPRWTGELGVLGFVVIGMRVWVTGSMALKSVRALFRADILPWLMLSNAAMLLPQGSWNQPTALGFSILSGALVLASTKRDTRASKRSRMSPSKQAIPAQMLA